MAAAEPAQPENRPAPLPALLSRDTPTAAHYRRNHFPYPDPIAFADHLAVDGHVRRPLRIPLDSLRERPVAAHRVLLECAGHRRTEIQPPVSGVQWRTGALSQAEWAGTPLAALLAEASPLAGACEVVLHGADRGPFAGVPGVHSFSRSLPLEKAAHPDTLLAWEMNGEPLPLEHGWPLRVVVPGWYAMDSVKWLQRIEVIAEPFRGPFQELDYRLQLEGETGNGLRLTEVPVNALILSPEEGDSVAQGRCRIQGIAWASAGVAAVEVRVDDGPWQPAALSEAQGPYEKSVWTLDYEAPPRDHRLSVRATDRRGRTQPEHPTWNRRGYANHSTHRITVRSKESSPQA